jgi:hypothetical protein
MRSRIPQDPEARSLIVGVSVAFYYSISSWSQVLVWPASQAPFCKCGRNSGTDRESLIFFILQTNMDGNHASPSGSCVSP